jgi:hypothetical protein
MKTSIWKALTEKAFVIHYLCLYVLILRDIHKFHDFNQTTPLATVVDHLGLESCMSLRSPLGIWILCLSLGLAQRQVKFFGLPTTFVTIFLFLRPENVFEDDRTDHHAKDKEPAGYEQTSKYAAKDTDGTAVIQGFCYCKGGILRKCGQSGYLV